jgi:hypothetical protein
MVLTGSGSYWHFRFKSWYIPAIQVQTLNGLHVDRFLLVVNDLVRKTIRGVEVVMAFRNLRLGKNSSTI